MVEAEAEWAGEIFPGLFFERPHITLHAPEGCIHYVGLNRWRFSKSGVVRVTKTIKRRRNPMASPGSNHPKMILATDWFVTDAVLGKTKPLWDAIKGRLEPLRSSIPGFGYLGLPSPNPLAREDPRECERCHRTCTYPAGRAPGAGDFHSPWIMRSTEWAQMIAAPKELPSELDDALAVFGSRSVHRVRYICSGCIPPGFVFCGNCNLIHKGWQTSRYLKPYQDMLKAIDTGRVPHEFVEREYRGSGRDAEGRPIYISKRTHLSERVRELSELIGRCSVCEFPDQSITMNLSDYLEQMTLLYDHWRAYAREG